MNVKKMIGLGALASLTLGLATSANAESYSNDGFRIGIGQSAYQVDGYRIDKKATTLEVGWLRFQ